MTGARDTNLLPYYDVVISGNGPGGLASAWEAVMAGKTVLIVSNHAADFVRSNRDFVKSDRKDYLISMLLPDQERSSDDEHFITNTITEPVIAIKEVERFIQRRLNEFPPSVLTYLYESQLSELRLQEEDTVVITSLASGGKITVGYETIIGADGTKHHAADRLNGGWHPSEPGPIVYNNIASPKHEDNVNAYITIEREDKAELILPEKNFLVMADEKSDSMYCLSIDKNSLQKNDNKKVKCHFISELTPNQYAQLQPDEAITLDEIKTRIASLLGKENCDNGNITVNLAKKSRKHGEMKDKLRLLFFKTKLMQANLAAIESVRDPVNGCEVPSKKFFLVGDAYRHPDYHFAHGATDALAQAEMIGKVLAGESTIKEYNQFCRDTSARMTAITKESQKLNVKQAAQLFEDCAELYKLQSKKPH